MQIIYDINAYIERLKADYGLNITLHPTAKELLISESILMKYNFHNSGFCVHLKTNNALHRKCVSNQAKIREKLLTTPCFTGVCHAGCKERVYGVYLENELLGFVSVVGYKADRQISAPRLEFVCKEFGFIQKDVLSLYEKLGDCLPEEALLDSLIFPLCRMIEYGNYLLRKSRRSDGLYMNILSYLSNYYTENICVEDIAKAFFVSPSQVSHTFKKNNGKSIREYLTFLRIEYAKILLNYTQNSITDIAMTCGFADCSYFCRQFKAETGISPKTYRSQNQLS